MHVEILTILCTHPNKIIQLITLLMKRSLLLITGLFFFSTGLYAQYDPGDIAIVRYNTSSPDGFSFVALVAIASGDSLYFTDEGWDDTAGATGWRVSNEEHLKYVSPGLSAGDVVHIEESSADNFTVSGAGGTVTLARGSGFSLTGGDQIIAYSGANGVRPSSPVFLTALHGDDGAATTTGSNDPTTTWTRDGEVAGTQQSTLPTGLTNGVDAVSVFGTVASEVANMIYDCSVTSGTKAALLLAINSRTNWTTSGSNQGTGSVCTFTVSSDPSVVIRGDAGWRMLSLPKTGGTVNDVSDDSPVQGITDGSDASAAANFYINTASDGTSENGYAEPTNVSTAWGDGLGFIMFFFNNTTNGSSTLPIALDASGSEPGNTDVTISNTYTLLGNPFQSNLNMTGITGNDAGVGVNDGLVSPISIWNDSSGSFKTFNFGEGNVIDEWQGFFVQRNSSSTTSIRIATSGKTTNSSTASIFNKGRLNNFRKIELHMTTSEGLNDFSNKLYFTDISGEGRDAFDGGKLNSLAGAPTLAFLQNFDGQEEILVQDARNFDISEEQNYQLILNDAGVSGEYTISWPVMKNIPEGWELVFTDLDNGTSVNMMEEDSYSFIVAAQQKRIAGSILLPPSLQAKVSQAIDPRFSIRLIPGTAVSTEDDNFGPEEFALDQNFPNPFNPTTNIRYNIPEAGQVTLSVFNILGQNVRTLVNTRQSAGTHTIAFDASNLSSGVYIYQLRFGSNVLTRKLTLIK